MRFLKYFIIHLKKQKNNNKTIQIFLLRNKNEAMQLLTISDVFFYLCYHYYIIFCVLLYDKLQHCSSCHKFFPLFYTCHTSVLYTIVN